MGGRVRLFIAAVLLLLFFLLYINTGFLQASAIDDKDLQHWQYENGVIKGSEGFTLQGNTNECWVMVHGYTTTPDELRIVAEAVNKEFNDTVYVPRLDGRGMKSSDIEKFTVEHWYQQVDEVATRNNCKYLLGSSMGASIALRYAETHPVKGIVLSGTPLLLQPHYLPTGIIAAIASPIVGYSKRDEPGQTIDDPNARSEHITGYSFPLKPVAQLDNFNHLVQNDLGKIRAQVLFLHPENDTVAHINGAREAYDKINSEKRFVVLNGDHIVFRDYDKNKAVQEVLTFRAS